MKIKTPSFVTSALWCATLLAATPLNSVAGPAAAGAGRPNLVIIVSDDHRPECLGYFKHPDVKTPYLDRLAEQGVVFRNAYVSAANGGNVCTPSRTQLHSGRSLYHWQQKRPAETEPAGYALGRAFRAAGYATLRSGKGVNVPSPLNAEFERNVEDSTLPLATHLANAVPFIQENAGRRPFLLVLEPRIPHSPYESTEAFRALYSPAALTLPPEYRPKHPFLDVSWGRRPGALGRDAAGNLIPTPPVQEWTEPLARATLAKYYASISYLDDGVGKIVATLRETGVLSNTYIIFLGDNGFSISHHGLYAKSDLYENGGLHVPVVIAGPGLAHRDSPAFVYMMDLFPTLCELAGIPIPARVDGRSLAGVLRGEKENVRDYAFTVFRDEQFSVRDARWKLIRFPKLDRVQLFDLQTDPRELTDLAGNSDQSERIATMTALLEREKSAAGYVWPLKEP